MAPEDKVGFTKRQVRLFEQAEAAVEKAKARVKAAEAELDAARSALRGAETELHRINELGDCL